MREKVIKQHGLLPHLFRLEYSKMTAVLCRHFGLQHIEAAEDIASETFLKATETWEVYGVPENPVAWLYTVAKNKTKDYLKHRAVFETKIKTAFSNGNGENERQPEIDFSEQIITDSQLAMIFAVCNPANSPEAQICLALQILCGFSVQEITDAFLSKTETIKKRLLRARQNLRNNHFEIKNLPEEAVRSRQDTVLKTLYLLFNEGYFSKSNNQLIRKDFCSEAIRLALVLTRNPLTNTPQTNALLALMCFQSSRLDARTNETGEAVLFEKQDKSQWNNELIEQGNYYLVEACTGNEVSKYHLEAAIAYWHTTPTGNNKWKHILQLYNQLVQIEYSPMTALNRTFAFAKVYGNEKAICEAEKLKLEENGHYHALLGYLYSDTNVAQAITYYEKAVRLSKSVPEQKTLKRELDRLTNWVENED
jgi:RNA polymerase sigma-70 factor (ECF subfamily)